MRITQTQVNLNPDARLVCEVGTIGRGSFSLRGERAGGDRDGSQTSGCSGSGGNGGDGGLD